MTPRFLGLQQVIKIHRDQIERYGGSSGIRDMGLLESALAMPRSGFGGQYFHTDLHEMAAAYLFHIVKNHPFLDGNKRVGAAAALVFLELNGVEVRVSDDRLATTVLAVAEGRLQKSGIAEFFRKHARPVRPA
ncbi:MAG: type II toxin-antitoxin system death-on-curing family toxin [Planctomycetes bacterium]|nr:type II toxin-antitoxin system death-on-curing family toxin [Planctomycetota bacterium]